MKETCSKLGGSAGGLLLSFLIAALPIDSMADDLLKYDAPASKWRESLPLGNGHLGVTVFGGVHHEQLQLSENSIYSGGWGTLTIDPLEAEYIKRQRETAIAGDVDAAMALSFEEFKKGWKGAIPEPVQVKGFCRVSKPVRRPVEQTLGDMSLFFSIPEEVVEDYERQLDLDTAVATTSYKVGSTLFKREAFCSYPDDVLVMRVSSSGKQQITFSADVSRPTDVLALTKKRNLSGFMKSMVARGVPAHVEPITRKTFGNDMVIFDGQAFDNGTKFRGALKIATRGGRVYTKDDRIHVKNAEEAILFFSCSTDYYHGAEWQQAVLKKVDAASKKPFSELLKNHLADYQKIYKRVDVSLGKTRATELPVSERLRVLNTELDLEGADRDPDIYALQFQFGRYLLISSSRKGYFPPGYIYWCPDLLSEWFGGHADDINQQMNYWPADVCNMPEVLEPMFDVLDSYVEGAKAVAKHQYGSRGMMIAGFTPYGMVGPKQIWPGANIVGFPAGTGWFAQHYWEHYLFTRDQVFLRNRAYPFIKEAALFYLDYLAKDPKSGHLVSFPDVSPELSFIKPSGEKGVYTVGATFTLAVCREVFANCIQASKLLGVDESLRAECEQALGKIAPYQIGKYGQLQEWLSDYEEASPGHRHVSHLYPVHPGYEITPDTHPKLAAAAKQSLLRRQSHEDGYGYVGWSRAWFANIFARLREPELAHGELKMFVSKCTFPSMLGTSQLGKEAPDKLVNNIDGNFGYTAGLAEMLLQSHLGVIHLLPALPKENWPSGHFKGLKARGGYEVDAQWKDGKLTQAVIRAKQSGTCRVRYGEQYADIPVKTGETYVLGANLELSEK